MPISSRSRPGMICCWPWVKGRGLLPLLVSRTCPPSSFSVYSMLTLEPFCTVPLAALGAAAGAGTGGGVGVCADSVDANTATKATASFTIRVIVTSSAHERGEQRAIRLYTRPPGPATRLARPRVVLSSPDLESLLRLVSARRWPLLSRGARTVRRRQRDARGLPPSPPAHPGQPAVALLPRGHLPGGGPARRGRPARPPRAGLPGGTGGEGDHGSPRAGAAGVRAAGQRRPPPGGAPAGGGGVPPPPGT